MPARQCWRTTLACATRLRGGSLAEDTVRMAWRVKIFLHLELELMNQLRETAEAAAIKAGLPTTWKRPVAGCPLPAPKPPWPSSIRACAPG